MSVTEDLFLGGLVRLRQDKNGLRATSDSVLAAAAVRAKTGDSVLDVGTGNGVILFCLNARVPHLNLTGVELQERLCQTAKENALLNNAAAEIIQADISRRVIELHGRQFHHVVSNPPFYTEEFERQSPQTALAYHEKTSLNDWLSFCVRHVRPKGGLTLIHRPEALADILAFLSHTAIGALEIIPIQSKEGENARRIIVRGKLGSKQKLSIFPALVMHDPNGSRSMTAENILRNGMGF